MHFNSANCSITDEVVLRLGKSFKVH